MSKDSDRDRAVAFVDAYGGTWQGWDLPGFVRVAAEFWVTATSRGKPATFAGCFIARLASDGRCVNFREYWLDETGHTDPYEGWGE